MLSQRRPRKHATVPFNPADNLRWAPALELARECEYEADHAHQVTGLALRLFDEFGRPAGLEGRWRACLTNAGLLHDIGWIEGRAGHHKTALRLIRESPHLRWSPRMRLMVGAVARYHRGALPRLDQACFGALAAADRDIVRKLAALLRLADGLDYTHQSLVRDVQGRITPERIELVCLVRAPASDEIERARKKSDLLRRVFNREVDVQCRLSETEPSARS